jgi:N-methylhydantoinase B
MVPGGFSATATEIVQEGLRLPPVKLVRRGEICQDIIDIILNNIRVAEERIGDIRAQLGALSVGEKRLTQLLDRYSVETVDAAIAELKAGSEQLMRAHIDSIPDGTYSATAIVDSDGIVDRPLEVVLDMTVSGSDIHFDLSRSSPPCRGPMNSVWATTQSAIYVAMKHIFPDVPINAGCFAPIHVAPPDGTFLYARYPRPVAGCAAEVAQRIMEAVFGAMGKAIPERLFAAPAGTSGNFGLGGYDPEENRHYIMYLFSGGGYGGWWQTDGLTNGCSSVGISKTQPVEILEQHYPILFDRFALREGSGGAGRHRGGFGVDYQIRLLPTVSSRSATGRFSPAGLRFRGRRPCAMRLFHRRRGERYGRTGIRLCRGEILRGRPGRLLGSGGRELIGFLLRSSALAAIIASISASSQAILWSLNCIGAGNLPTFTSLRT